MRGLSRTQNYYKNGKRVPPPAQSCPPRARAPCLAAADGGGQSQRCTYCEGVSPHTLRKARTKEE